MNRYLCKRENFPNKPAGHSIETKPNFRNEKLFSPLQPESFGQLANQEGERERELKRGNLRLLSTSRSRFQAKFLTEVTRMHIYTYICK